MNFMTRDQGENISRGESETLKDFEKLYPDEDSLLSYEIENGHLTRLGILLTIEELPASIGNLKWLLELRINDSELWDLPESIGKLESLQVLDLSDNPITEFPESIGNLTSLRELTLYHVTLSKFTNYRLTTLPESFGNLKSLERLDLEQNYLETLPKTFGTLESLRELNLRWNKLRTLPETFSNLKSLQDLMLRGNKLNTLPESIGNLKVLQKLELSQNELRTLPESIGNLESLKEINLEENSLIDLPETLLKLSNLEKIEINENPLGKSAKRILEHLTFGAYVDGFQSSAIYEISLQPSLIESINQHIAHHKGEPYSSIPEFMKQAIGEKIKEPKSIPARISQEENTFKVIISLPLHDRICDYIDHHKREEYSSLRNFIKQVVQEKIESIMKQIS